MRIKNYLIHSPAEFRIHWLTGDKSHRSLTTPTSGKTGAAKTTLP
jgi:hypothetical protein